MHQYTIEVVLARVVSAADRVDLIQMLEACSTYFVNLGQLLGSNEVVHREVN